MTTKTASASTSSPESPRRNILDVLRDNLVSIIGALVMIGCVYGTISARLCAEERRTDTLERWREEDHDTLKDVQGDVKAILKSIEKK